MCVPQIVVFDQIYPFVKLGISQTNPSGILNLIQNKLDGKSVPSPALKSKFHLTSKVANNVQIKRVKKPTVKSCGIQV